jgi:hypothetical protein
MSRVQGAANQPVQNGVMERESGPRGVLHLMNLDVVDTLYLSINFRKSTPPQNRELDILIINSKQ